MKTRIKILILFIIVGAGAAVAVNMGLLESEDPPENVKEQIEALETRNYEITSVKDTGELYKVRMELLEIPGDKTVEKWARATCAEVHLILRGEGLTRDISVKTYADILGGKTKYYGEVYYDASIYQYTFEKPE
ncbi:MAG: hypothetical protein R6U37_01095 [Dehalococcoidia bacterium]